MAWLNESGRLAEQAGRYSWPAFVEVNCSFKSGVDRRLRDLLTLLPEDHQVKARPDDREQQDQDHQHNLCCRISVGIHYIRQCEYVQNDDCKSKKRTQHGGSPFIALSL